MRVHRIHNTNRKTTPKKGFVSLEVILVLPILMILLLGLLEFSLLFSARGQVVDAARAGARVATLHGIDEYFVEDEVYKNLGPYLSEYASIETEMGEYSGDEVLVTVRVPMASATPDLLWPVGYSVQGQVILAQARMLKE